ncbi:MAG: polysaccharide deacetylase family protein [Lachnospiraceae bacterium]|nr:polysaccharide deacetylase family protein [Lachnospiraceae bacterium]
MDTATLDTKEEDAAEDNIVAEEEETPEALAEGAKEEEEDAAGVEATAEVKTPPEGWEFKLASEDWGLSYGESGAQPVGNASAEDLAWYDAYFIGDDSEKVLYLTFDCGYENGNTEPILDALKKHDAKGTFFVVGHFLETAPEMVQRMVDEGHAVGNHTYHHLDMPTISEMEKFQEEMDGVADKFEEITGTKLSPYYRPPQGKCNENNLKMAQELGYCTIFWSLAHVDWNQDSQPGYDESIQKLTSRVHPGAIVLLHNTSKTNGEILDELLTKWEEMGYSFQPLSELTGK